MRIESARRRAARISLTPLIDVVFILLLFFMLTSRFGQQQVLSLQLPGAGGTVGSAIDSVSLRLAANGSVLTGANQRLEPSDFASHPTLRDIVAANGVVRMDVNDDVSLQMLISTLDRLESLGLENVEVRGLRR